MPCLGGTLSVAESYLKRRLGMRRFDESVSDLRAEPRFRGACSMAAWRNSRAMYIDSSIGGDANTRTGSRRNIGAHYDLGNDFFRLWLDDTMAYSSGIFPAPGASLRDASVEKFDRVCRKLGLAPSDEVSGNRHRLGWLCDPRGEELRLPRNNDHDFAGTVRSRTAANQGGGVRQTSHSAASRIIATCAANSTSWSPLK